MVAEEVVWVQLLDPVRLEGFFGEVLQVLRHDHIASADDSRRQDMTVIEVREVERRDQGYVACNQAISCCLVHEISCPLECRAVPIWLVAHQSFDPLTVNVFGPFGLEDIGHSELHEHVAHRRRIENVGVEKRRIVAHGLP